MKAPTVFTVVLVMSACTRVLGDGTIVEVEQNFSEVSGLKNSTSILVELRVDPDATTTRARLACDSNLLEHIILEEVDSTLELKTPIDVWISPSENCLLRLDTQDLGSVKLTGSGDMVLSGLNTTQFDAKTTGSGTLNISGRVGLFDAKLTGSGGMNAEELDADIVVVKVTGSGGASVSARDEVEVKVTGSGSVRIVGEPSRRELSATGSGDIRFEP